MIVLLSIGLLLTLLLWLRLNAFLALVITALATGLAAGMPAAKVVKTIQNGIGSTLGGLVLVLAFGIMLGSILSETGAAQIIAERMIRLFGPKRVHWAVAVTGFVVGVAMFYNAGFVVLAPLVFSLAFASGQSLVSLAIAMAAPLSVTHGFLPPHPGASAVASLFGAGMGKTLLFGLLIAIPTIIVAGIVFPKYFLKNILANPPKGLFEPRKFDVAALPGFGQSLFVALLPVLCMAISTGLELVFTSYDPSLYWFKLVGDPGVSMLLAVLAGLLLFSKNRLNKASNLLKTTELLEKSSTALGAASTILLVIAAGGAFKQVLVDSGLGQNLATQLSAVPVSPLVLGWGIATVLRILLGSATVAGTTAAGIALPMVSNGSASPELMTLAVGAGSLMCSHVNDTGFWMFREWFGLSLRDTFRSWTLMETIVGLMGLAGVLMLDLFI